MLPATDLRKMSIACLSGVNCWTPWPLRTTLRTTRHCRWKAGSGSKTIFTRKRLRSTTCPTCRAAQIHLAEPRHPQPLRLLTGPRFVRKPKKANSTRNGKGNENVERTCSDDAGVIAYMLRGSGGSYADRPAIGHRFARHSRRRRLRGRKISRTGRCLP